MRSDARANYCPGAHQHRSSGHDTRTDPQSYLKIVRNVPFSSPALLFWRRFARDFLLFSAFSVLSQSTVGERTRRLLGSPFFSVEFYDLMSRKTISRYFTSLLFFALPTPPPIHPLKVKLGSTHTERRDARRMEEKKGKKANCNLKNSPMSNWSLSHYDLILFFPSPFSSFFAPYHCQIAEQNHERKVIYRRLSFAPHRRFGLIYNFFHETFSPRLRWGFNEAEDGARMLMPFFPQLAACLTCLGRVYHCRTFKKVNKWKGSSALFAFYVDAHDSFFGGEESQLRFLSTSRLWQRAINVNIFVIDFTDFSLSLRRCVYN